MSVVIDSSAWIELFNDGFLAKACQKELESADQVIVPSVVIYEVYRKITMMTSEDQGLSAVAVLTQHLVSELSNEIALLAADLSIEHRLGMTDSIVLAHAHQSNAKLITLDNDFAKVPGTKVLRRN